MADGCNLYFTQKDLQQVEQSLAKGSKPSEAKTAANILNGRIINSAKDFLSILANHKDPRYKIVDQLLRKALSNGKLNGNDEDKLSSALWTVLDFQNNPQGLFQNPPKYIGPGADSMQHGAELLTTAAIMQNTFPWGGIQTSLGNKLHIDKDWDVIGFGQKLPAKFALPTRKRGTIEADTLISRITKYDPILGQHEFDRIAIDTKYIKEPKILNPTYGVMPGFERQLEGIRNAFSDGSIQEFYFVSNVEFTDGFKSYVKEYNIKIFKDSMENDRDIQSGVEKIMSKSEKEFYIPDEFDNIDLSKNYEVVEKAAKQFGIPQIGWCENVNYT